MLHPVGPQPPSVYWRRRLLVLGSVVLLIVLIVLTVNTLKSGDGGQPVAGSGSPTTRPAPSTSTRPSTTPRPSSSSRSPSPSHSSRHTTPKPSPTPTPTCSVAALHLQAGTTRSTYKVGDEPTLQLKVTNPGPGPCAQDLADKQVELRVYNGESRIWGSHDCSIQPGKDVRTLMPNKAVIVSLKWRGLSSTPGCKGTRQRVGAGTYTLYARLSGRTGHAVQFSFS
jgi:hypothetical protein